MRGHMQGQIVRFHVMVVSRRKDGYNPATPAALTQA